jgi:carbamoylphosphate synthase small subunit
MKRKIFVVDGGMAMSAGSWMQGDFVPNMDDANLVVFTGGADINPALYGEQRHPATSCYDRRDAYEVAAYKKANSMGLNMLGICRGAQLLCAMAGGKLVQHQQNLGAHPIEINKDGLEVHVTSCHHQAQYPWHLPPDEWQLLGWSEGISMFHEGANKEEMVNNVGPAFNIEVEDVFYRKIRALAIQSHPEWLPHHAPAITHYRKLLDAMQAGDI